MINFTYQKSTSMNKSSLILISLFIYSLSYSQVTDNGSNVGVGTTSPESKLHIFTGNAGIAPHGYSDLTVEDDAQGMISILTPNNQLGYFGFADSDDSYVGGLQYDHASDKSCDDNTCPLFEVPIRSEVVICVEVRNNVSEKIRSF